MELNRTPVKINGNKEIWWVLVFGFGFLIDVLN